MSPTKKKRIPWTRFMDMHSGGGSKEKWGYIYIEAPEDEAKRIFYARFGHNPERVTCTCCGEDYSITESVTLDQATGYNRGCHALETPRNAKTQLYERPSDLWFDEHYYIEPKDVAEAKRRGYAVSDGYRSYKYTTLAAYIKSADVKVIRAKDIRPRERKARVPVQGYVWQDGEATP